MNLDNLSRRLSKLEERDAQRIHTWRLEDGRRVSFSAIDLYGGYMELNKLLYEAWCNPGEEPPPFTSVLSALEGAAPGERERIAQRCQWLQSWDALTHQLHNPPLEALEEV